MKRIKFTKFDKLDYTRAEQFNSISVNLDFCGDDIKTISVTSTRENEGKSFVSMQLMRTCAENGKKVILLDCDLRKSRIIRDYGVECEEDIMGMSHYLAGIASYDDIIYNTNIENASIILAGKSVSNPVNLLKKERFSELLENLRKIYDVVIVDTPPVQPVIDGAYIAQKCDGTVLVIDYGKVSVYEILDTKNQLLAAHSTILGTVLNNVPFNSGRYYYKSSKYYNKYRYRYYKNYGRYSDSQTYTNEENQ
jgi:capsular exopolysaccharide synthesis family protein